MSVHYVSAHESQRACGPLEVETDLCAAMWVLGNRTLISLLEQPVFLPTEAALQPRTDLLLSAF